MKTHNAFSAAALIVALMVCGCDSPPPPPKATPTPMSTPTSVTAATPAPQPTAQPAALQPPWPYIDDAQATELAADPLVKNYVLIFDGSGSMGETDCGEGRTKIAVAREAVKQWIKLLPPQDNLGLVAFHNNGWIEQRLRAGDRQALINQVQSIVYGGKTPLTRALRLAFQELTRQGRRQLGYGEYTMVIITDGIANDETRLAKLVGNLLRQSPINIYTIGFCISSRHALNQPGQTTYHSANNPAELRQGLQAVLAESETFDDAQFQ